MIKRISTALCAAMVVAAMVVAALVVAATVQAAPSAAKYSEWEKSPQAYFMTSAEHGQWVSITTDDAADAFIKDFVAKRGGSAFTAEVEKRATMADKYLSVGKVHGSETIAGKILILFGAPSNVAFNDRTAVKKHYNAPQTNPSDYVGSGNGPGVEEGEKSATATSSGQMFRDYTFTFNGKASPGMNRDEFVTTVSIDLASGKTTLKDKKQQRDLDSLFESVAEASIKTP
jgi:GWxTD domain-containing protein